MTSKLRTVFTTPFTDSSHKAIGKQISYKLPVSETEFESIFATFEEVFARPLSINEVQKLSDLMHDFDKDKVIDALRESEARNKLSLAYIEVILRNNNDVTKD